MRLLLATLLILVGTSTAAWAHAALISVEPASGSMLASAPKAVELRFNEAVTPGAIQLIDGAGRARDDARVTASGESISVAMPPDLPKGTAVVSYRVISQDGHPVAGSVIFSIGMPTGTQPPANVDGGLNALIWLSRIGLYLGLFVGVGGVFFARWISWSMAGMSVPRAALLVGLPSAVVVAWRVGSRSPRPAAGSTRDSGSLDHRIRHQRRARVARRHRGDAARADGAGPRMVCARSCGGRVRRRRALARHDRARRNGVA